MYRTRHQWEACSLEWVERGIADACRPQLGEVVVGESRTGAGVASGVRALMGGLVYLVVLAFAVTAVSLVVTPGDDAAASGGGKKKERSEERRVGKECRSRW